MGRKPKIPKVVTSSADIDESLILENEFKKLDMENSEVKPETDNLDVLDPEEKPTKLSRKEKQALEIKERIANISPSDYETFTKSIQMLFEMISVKGGEHWKLSDIEAKSIGVPLTQVFVKYVPNFDYTAEMFLALAVSGIVIPRVQQTRELKNANP